MPVSGRTYQLVGPADFDGSTLEQYTPIYPQRTANHFGVVQCDWAGDTAGGEGFKLELLGRMSSSMNWVVLEVFDETDMDSNLSSLKAVRLLPEMVAEIVSITGDPSAGELICTLQD